MAKTRAITAHKAATVAQLQVKICGLNEPRALAAAQRNGASHVGFVFFEPSPRHISLDQAAELAQSLAYSVRLVAVVVDPAPDYLAAIIDRVAPDIIQFHGKETPQTLAYWRSKRVKIWKALPVAVASDLLGCASFVGVADRLLYDAKAPTQTPGSQTPDRATLPGGMGRSFDWSLLAGHRHLLPWGLSGGLDSGNVAEAILRTAAPLLDVSSGVESAPGIKDIDKIAHFLKAAHHEGDQQLSLAAR